MAIQPESFDLIVAGTGLEESLIAANAAKSGKSVLHVDQAKNYGAAWSSLTLEETLAWVQSQKVSPAKPVDLTNEVVQLESDQQLPGALHIPAQDQQTPLYDNVELYQQQEDLGPSREYSLDLAGKVVFCASDTISTVLTFGVQNYLEFKLVQGSYVLSGGKLVSVPASRAAVFRDKHLSPMDKRVLTRFLMQLGSSLHDNPFPQAAPEQPMVNLLRSQGLSPLMRHFILHAVAMADADQEALLPDSISNSSIGNASISNVSTQHTSPTTPDTTARQAPAASASSTGSAQSDRGLLAASSTAPSAASERNPPPHADPSADLAGSASLHSQHAAASSASATHPGGVLTVEQGVKALRQYLSSVGQYGASSGAFLTPMYGCAELPQAFCRVAAVHGAVYVLRQPITRLLLHPETHQCQGIQTDAGQVIKCSALAASAGTLVSLHRHLQLRRNAADSNQQQPEAPRTCRAPGSRLSKAICILDGSLQEGESQLFVTIPPQTEPLQNPNAIRAVQCGSTAAVCPSNRHLLYLSTPSTAETASADLSKAVSALVRTDRLPANSLTKSKLPDSFISGASSAAGLDNRPAALLVIFYNQDCQQGIDDNHVLPSNVACCLPPDGSVDTDSAVRHANQAFNKLYPDASPVLGVRPPEDEDAVSDDEALDALGDVLQGLT